MNLQKNQTKTELAEYLHKCAFGPSLSTFQKAIRKGHFITWPSITKINFEKHITKLLPAAKGHLDQERSNLQTTKKQIESNKEDDNFFPQDGIGDKTYKNSAIIYPFGP